MHDHMDKATDSMSNTQYLIPDTPVPSAEQIVLWMEAFCLNGSEKPLNPN